LKKTSRQVSLFTFRLVYKPVFIFSFFYKGYVKISPFWSIFQHQYPEIFCTAASAKSNTWLQFNLKLADRVVFSKELHLSVESIKPECSLQTREGSSYPRKKFVSCGKTTSKT